MDPLTAAVVAGGVGSVLSGLSGQAAQESANNANHVEAEINRGFQERMRATAHQTEVEDLRAAGLNPILSAGGSGAAQPGGAQATMQPANADVGGNIVKTIASAFALKQQKANIDNLEQDTVTKGEQQSLTHNQAITEGAQSQIAQQKALQERNNTKIQQETMDSLIKQAKVTGDYSQVNAFLNAVKTGTSSAKDISDLLKPFSVKGK